MKRFDSINVIPFIDIMLVLLAIVLTTASFVATNKLNIKVPASSAEGTISTHEKEKVVELAINSRSEIYYNEKMTSLEELEPILTKLDKTTAINLRVDEAVNFGQFVKILDVFKRLQLEKFSIITEQIATSSSTQTATPVTPIDHQK